MKTERITKALAWVDGHREGTPDQFRRAMRQGGDMLLDAVQTLGYVERRGDRLELTVPGFHRLQDG